MKKLPKDKINIVSALKIKYGHYIKGPYDLPDEELDGYYLDPNFTGALASKIGVSDSIKKILEYGMTFTNSYGFCLYPKEPAFSLPFY